MTQDEFNSAVAQQQDTLTYKQADAWAKVNDLDLQEALDYADLTLRVGI